MAEKKITDKQASNAGKVLEQRKEELAEPEKEVVFPVCRMCGTKMHVWATKCPSCGTAILAE